MTMLHPTRNANPDAPECVKVLYAMWYELHRRRAGAGKGGEMPPPAVIPAQRPSVGGAPTSPGTHGAASSPSAASLGQPSDVGTPSPGQPVRRSIGGASRWSRSSRGRSTAAAETAGLLDPFPGRRS
eukprot:14612855-Alexandrium_andersonii.AAC.1